MDLTKQAVVVAFMFRCQTRDDWSYKTELVIKANNGLPAFLHSAIINSGLRAEIAKRWE